MIDKKLFKISLKNKILHKCINQQYEWVKGIVKYSMPKKNS